MIGFFRRWREKRAAKKEQEQRYKACCDTVAYFRKFCEDNQSTCDMKFTLHDVRHFSWIMGPFRIEQRIFDDCKFTIIEIYYQNFENLIFKYTYHGRRRMAFDRWFIEDEFTQEHITMLILSGEEYEMGDYEKWKYYTD